MKEKRKEILIFIAIIAAQVLVMFYWAGVKSNFFVDELYSIGYANSFTGLGDCAQYITTSNEWKLNEWVDSTSLKRHIIVSDNEKVYKASVQKIAKRMIQTKNYYGLLNISESFFGNQDVSVMPGFLLNLIFLLIFDIALMAFMKQLGMSENMRYMSLVMLGFSGYIVSAATYVRFYMFVMMMMILMLILLLKVWRSDRWPEIILSEVGILLLGYVQYKNTELLVIYLGACLVCFIIAFFILKKKKQMISFLTICVSAFIYVVFFTNYLVTLIHPEQNAKGMSVVYKASRNIRGFSLYAMKVYLFWLKEQFEKLYFSSYWILIFLLGAITVCLIISSKNDENSHFELEFKRLRPITLCSLIIWFVILIVSLILGKGWLLSSVVVLIIVTIALIEIMGVKPGIRSIALSSDSQFVVTLIAVDIIYTCFEMMAGHDVWRYYCYGMISFSIILWYVIDRILKNKKLAYAKRPLSIILLVFVILNALIPFKSRNIEFIYESDKPMINNIQNCGDVDVVLMVDVNDDGQVPLKETYDCVYLMSDDAKLYATDIDDSISSIEDYPNEFILWTQKDMEIEDELDDLQKHGYESELLGRDHESKAYLLSKNL